MQRLIDRRCHYHSHREAVARCPECSRYFCRECITEHADRVVCTSCLRHATETSPGTRQSARGVFFKAVQAFLGIFILWMSFFYFGQLLLTIPDAFHEGTIWQSDDRGER